MKRLLLAGLLLGLLFTPAVTLAADPDPKQAKSKWRATGHYYALDATHAYYAGVMKGTFFVKSDTAHTAYMNAVQMACPFSVRIHDGGQDVLQGACQFTDQDGHTVRASLACVGPHDEECKGRLTLLAGTGRYAGIEGDGEIRLRETVNVGAEPTEPGFGVPLDAHGYLVIRSLKDNVVFGTDGPRVR